MVVVLVLVRSPPNGVLGVFVHDDVLILGGTTSVNTSHNVDSTQLADLTLFVAYQFGLGLFLEQQLVGRIVHDLSRAGDAILGKIQICHVTNTSFLKNGHVYSALSSHRISQKAIEIYDCVFSYLTLYIKNSPKSTNLDLNSHKSNKFGREKNRRGPGGGNKMNRNWEHCEEKPEKSGIDVIRKGERMLESVAR